ncbi:hypothetical protein [Streptomyces sp. NPDC047928]|uniref:hypothetical protein n=1 Tax=unclassified Streptomyces TaxID=2593676 RepID=UPI0037221CAB
MDMRTWRTSWLLADDAADALADALRGLGLPGSVRVRPLVTASGTPYVEVGVVRAEVVRQALGSSRGGDRVD